MNQGELLETWAIPSKVVSSTSRNELVESSTPPTLAGSTLTDDTPYALRDGSYTIRRGLSSPNDVFWLAGSATNKRSVIVTYSANVHLVQLSQAPDKQARRSR